MKFTEEYHPFEVNIVYKGCNSKLDADIRVATEQFGGKDMGSGYSSPMGERDLQFGFNDAHNARLFRKKIKTWKTFQKAKGQITVSKLKPYLEFHETEL